MTAGYTDLRAQFEGEDAYSYVFDGQLGYLDHALAAPGLVREVVGTAGWTINADESSLIDYDMTYKRAAQDALFAPDPFRSSDHDPVIIGLDLVPPADTTAPELVVTADPAVIAGANNKDRGAPRRAGDDDSGAVAVELVEATSSGSRADLRVISWTDVEVRAVKRAVYTLRYEATDPSGNVTTYEVTIRVAP